MSVKDVLYAWLGKNKKGNPVYDVQNGLRNRFKCELRVAGYSYIGMGNSTNKKDAATNAAMDFCNFLVRQGEMKPDEVPSLNSGSLESTMEMPGNSGFGATEGSFFDGQPVQQAPPPRLNNNFTSHDQYVTQRAEEVAQSESVDLKAEIHGGWTVENSKSALNEFLQKTRQLAATYKTERKEANANISGFTSTLTVYIPQLNRPLNAQGQGSTKKVAEANCAMSMVRQLYHMKIIAEFQGARKKTKASNLPEIPVVVPETLASRVKEYVARQGVTPIAVDETAATPDEPKSLIVDHRLAHFPDSEITPPCNVSWSPPMQNWNPWRSCNIDEEPLAFMTLPQINERVGKKEVEKGASQVNAVRSQLPVAQFRQQIIETVAGNRVTLIKGETGCGKSTQVAQYLLESYIETNRGGEFNAYVSQPRRISAISLAERVATERNEQLGDSVGYGVRFDSVLPRPYGSIFFCTVGVLLRKMESGLRGVSHVIIDEIHERDIDTDFVLIVLREMVREFPDLRVVLMSATIDTKMFTEYFGGCPVIEMHGRTHPVQRFFLEEIIQMLEFMPPEPLKAKDEELEDEECDEKSKNLNILPAGADPTLRQAMSRIRENDIPYDIIEKILLDIGAKGEDGAVLIFLPGWQEIMTLLNQLTSHPVFSDASKYVILPLHSLLTAAEQRRVFDHFGEGVRKIILSTNIAETSVTIDDVVYVIDSCKSRERLYSTSNNMVHYATVWASRSNMAQRRGRAGRVRPGFAFHLCSNARFEALDEHRTAEILRTPLYAVALTIKLLRLGSVGEFLAKAIEPPPCDMVVESEAVLKTMGALDRNLELTALGRILARLPIEPGIGKTIVMGLSLGVGSLMCELAAASSFSSPFVPRERTHTRLSGPQRSFAGTRWSDHISLICVNQAFAEASEQGPHSEDSFCQRFSLNKPALKMTNGAKRQLLETLTAQCGFPMEAVVPIYADPNGVDQNLDLIASLLVASYYPNIAFYKGKRKVYTLEQASALVTKMSILTPFRGDVINLPSPLIVFTEKVRTRCISCKELTVVNAVQLILFGCRKVECVGRDLVRLDDMITLKMNVEVAAALIALRPCIERHLIMACTNPESLMAQSDDDRELIALLRELSSPSLFAEAGPKDYLITEQALQAVQPVNNTNGSSGNNRGRGRGFRGGGGSWGYGSRGGQRGGGGFGAARQEGFGGAGFGDAPRFQGEGPPPAREGPQRGFGFSFGNQNSGFGGGGGFNGNQGGFGFANGDVPPPPTSGGFGGGGRFGGFPAGDAPPSASGGFGGGGGRGFGGFPTGDAPPPASGGFGGGGGFGGPQPQPQQNSLQPPPPGYGGKWPSPRRDGGQGAPRPYQNRGRGGGGGGGRGRGGRGFRGGWF